MNLKDAQLDYSKIAMLLVVYDDTIDANPTWQINSKLHRSDDSGKIMESLRETTWFPIKNHTNGKIPIWDVPPMFDPFMIGIGVLGVFGVRTRKEALQLL